jgi:putative membrane protein
MIFESLATLPQFTLYFISAVILMGLFLAIYVRITPHREIELIRQGNQAAATKLGGVLIGYTIPLASVIAHSVDIPDLMVWGAIALFVQIGVYQAIRLSVHNLSAAIQNDNRAVGRWSAAVAIAVGILNAACITY